MTDQKTVRIECPCGWSETFSRGFSGLTVECGSCGRMHRVPTFADQQHEQTIDVDLVERLTGVQMADDQPKRRVHLRVHFKPWFIAAIVFAAIVTVVAVVAAPTWLIAASLSGGAWAWSLGIGFAWLGQRRQIKKTVQG